jgi:hypothetical protein
MEYKLLDKPLTIEEMRKMAEAGVPGGLFVTGVVAVDLNDIIDNDLDGFMDHLSELLTGTEILMNIDYDVVGYEEHNVLHIKVSGDVSAVLEGEDD